MRLKDHYTTTTGYTQVVSPQTHSVKDVDFGMVRLAAGQTYESFSAGYEIGLIVLSGTCAVTVGSESFPDLGGRATVFDGRATGIYVPRQTNFAITTENDGLEIALCRCPTEEDFPVQVVRPSEVIVHDVGGVGFHRYVHDILGSQIQAARMIIGETFTIAGNWSSFPPHKHDQEMLPVEVQQEELYLYKIRPEEGFGLQYFYSRPDSPYGALDEAVGVHQNDVTLMPFGYHPVSAPPGYDVYYLWFLTGPVRRLIPHDDPAYSWIKTAPPADRDYPR